MAFQSFTLNGHPRCKIHHADKGKSNSSVPDIKDLPLPSTQLFKHLHKRQYAQIYAPTTERLVAPYACRQLPALLSESEYPLGKINKIFASQWVSNRQVVFGTKCNKVIVMDMITKQRAVIPSLKSSEDSQPAECPCGIHSIAINPSKTLLATGAINTNDLAVYKLPTFDPVCVGEFGHTDWIFDIKWLDDQFVVSGSRDNTMALWCMKDDEVAPVVPGHEQEVPEYAHTRPVAVTMCRRAEKVRAMAYNSNTQEFVALSLNAYLHLWDANKFIQKLSHKLVHTRENVCIDVCETHNLYGVGSQSHVALIDPKSLKQINHIVSRHRGVGIRSVSFRDNLLTIGTGSGSIMFYDMRAGRYMEHDCGHTLELSAGQGWLLRDDTYRDYFVNEIYPNAIYTHSMDPSGTKLFAAGGPLPAGLWGNYAAMWS